MFHYPDNRVAFLCLSFTLYAVNWWRFNFVQVSLFGTVVFPQLKIKFIRFWNYFIRTTECVTLKLDVASTLMHIDATLMNHRFSTLMHDDASTLHHCTSTVMPDTAFHHFAYTIVLELVSSLHFLLMTAFVFEFFALFWIFDY